MAACVRCAGRVQAPLQSIRSLRRPANFRQSHAACTHRSRVLAAAKGEAEFMHDNNKFQKLKGVKPWLVSEQKQVDVTSLWNEDDTMMELACQLRDEVVEQAKQNGLKLYLVSIGPKERGIEFAEHLRFPKEQLLADPENVVYDALSLTNSVFDTFFNPKTPLALLSRARKDGGKQIKQVMGNWKFWIPTKQGQSAQQGGAFIFKGSECVWQYYDPATAAHVNPKELLEAALKVSGKTSQ